MTSNAIAESYLTPHPPSHPTLPLPPPPLSRMKNSTPSNAVKLIGRAILDEPLYPQIILALTKLASIATVWDISASIVNSTPVQLASAMLLIMSRIAAHSAVATTQLVPYPPHLHHPTILPLLLDQSIQYPLCLQIGFLLPPLDKPSVDPIALALPLRAFTPLPSDFTMLVLPPLVLTTMMSITLMLGITSMENRIFRWCLNATLGVMLRSPVSFFLSLVFLCFLFVSLLAECSIPTSRNSFYSVSSRCLRSRPLFSQRMFPQEHSLVLPKPSTTFFHFPFPLSYFPQ